MKFVEESFVKLNAMLTLLGKLTTPQGDINNDKKH